MNDIFTVFLTQPLLNGLMFFYKFTGNLGVALIIFTTVIRLVLIPLSLPSLKTAKKMRDLAPQLERLKLRHKDDKSKLAQAQMELYKQHGVNPTAGCLPQILQIVILIALVRMFYSFFSPSGNADIGKINSLLYPAFHFAQNQSINLHFLYLNLAHPDVFRVPGIPVPLPGLFLILAALVQYLSSKMMMPTLKKAEKAAKQTPQATDEMMVEMQQSMTWMFPVMTLLFGSTFPSGLVLYWFVFSLIQIIQQYLTTGWGGLAPWLNRFGLVQLTHESEKRSG